MAAGLAGAEASDSIRARIGPRGVSRSGAVLIEAGGLSRPGPTKRSLCHPRIVRDVKGPRSGAAGCAPAASGAWERGARLADPESRAAAGKSAETGKGATPAASAVIADREVAAQGARDAMPAVSEALARRVAAV
jgi:hypothetical protein